MKFLQIKQAEAALKDGRLDEACRIVQQPEVRDLAKAQKLIGCLARALTDRARAHLDQGLTAEAFADCRQAEKLGGVDPRRSALKDAICRAIVAQQSEDARQAQLLAQARSHLRAGDLSVCEELVEAVGCEQGGLLQNQAADQRQRIQRLADRLENALRQKDLPRVLGVLKGVDWQSLLDRDDPVGVLIARARLDCCGRIREALQAGRIDQAQLLADQVEPLVGDTLDYRELVRAIEKLERARDAVGRCCPQEAARILRQVVAMVPEADWLQGALAQADQAAHSLEALRNGPLGLMLSGCAPVSVGSALDSDAPCVAGPGPKPAGPAGQEAASGRAPWPNPFVIQVDGVGGYLVYPDSRITVGPISSARRPDLAVMAHAAGAVATIERFEEDYLLTSDQPVLVNKKQVTKSVLSHNDRVDLTHRVSLRFKKPHPASATALLEMTSARLRFPDIRCVVLLDRELVFGAGSGAHIRGAGWEEQVVLSYRQGRLYCDRQPGRLRDGRALAAGSPLPLGEPVRIGAVSLVVTPADRL